MHIFNRRGAHLANDLTMIALLEPLPYFSSPNTTMFTGILLLGHLLPPLNVFFVILKRGINLKRHIPIIITIVLSQPLARAREKSDDLNIFLYNICLFQKQKISTMDGLIDL